MTELSQAECNNILNLQVDTVLKYNNEIYKIINKSTSSYGHFIYIEKIPDNGKKYNFCLITKSNQLTFHILGVLTMPISYCDIELLFIC